MARTLLTTSVILQAVIACSPADPVESSNPAQAGSEAQADVEASSCAEMTPCGGDPSGRWEVEDTCMGAVVALAGCPTITVNQIHQIGILHLEPDATLSLVGESFSLVDYDYAPDCFGDDPEQCVALQGALSQAAASIDENVESSVACQVTDLHCRCLLTQTQRLDLTGTWASAGDQLTLNYNGLPGPQLGLSGTFDYCTAGDTLVTRSLPDAQVVQIFRKLADE